MLIEEALQEYEDFFIIEKGLSTNTHIAYLNDLNLFKNHLNSLNISSTEQITFNHIEDFFIKRANFVEINTLNREKSSIKNFLQYCLAIDAITEDFSNRLNIEKKFDFFPSVLTKEEITHLLNYTEKETHKRREENNPYKLALAIRNELMLKLLYGLGLRVSELIHIRIRDIYPEGWCRIYGKGDKIRNVPLMDNLLTDINIYVKNARSQILSHKHNKKSLASPVHLHILQNDHGFLLVNHHGKPLSRIAVWKWVKDLAKTCNIGKNIYPHTFRHTCATHLLKGGADLRVIQELVGHSNIQTTELYTHLQTDDVKASFIKYHPLYE